MRLEKIMLATMMKNDIKKLSQDVQTASVEAHNNTILTWAPKHTAYGYVGMVARYLLISNVYTGLMIFKVLMLG